MKLSLVHENCQLLETKLAEKESIISENGKLISNFQKEVDILAASRNIHARFKFTHARFLGLLDQQVSRQAARARVRVDANLQ